MPVHRSPSWFNLFAECRRCFWLRVDERIERPSGPFPSLPGGMDRAIKAHFDRFRADVERAVETLRGPVPEHDPDCEYCGWNAAEHA